MKALFLNQSGRSEFPGINGVGNHPQILPGRGDRAGWFARFFALAAADDMTAEFLKAESGKRKAEEFLRDRSVVDQAAHNRCVAGSIPAPATIFGRGDSRLATVGLASCVMKLGRPFSFLRLRGPQPGGRKNRRVFGRLGQLLQINGGVL